MQYLLSEKEFDDLTHAKDDEILNYRMIIQNLCFRLAEAEIVEHYNGDKKPWGCVKNGTQTYCDLCPVKVQCAYSGKRVSK